MNSRYKFKEKVEIRGVVIMIKTNDFELQSDIKDLPTEVLQDIENKIRVTLLERSQDWDKYSKGFEL